MTFFKSKKNFQGQNYSKLKDECVKRGEKFSDPKFPPHDSSIYFSKQPPSVIAWKRPHEIVDNPRLFVEGASTNDVVQGELGNCWFVAACSTLVGVKELWQKVIPDYRSQEYGVGTLFHPGLFHFRFWRFGQWIDVVVDDLLPTVDGKLVFSHSRDRGEFWCALLEKAYAKVHGSYEALEGGNLSDALVDLTSGVSAHLELTTGGYLEDFEKRKQLFAMMQKELTEHALMCCTISTGEAFPRTHTHDEADLRNENGLVKGHSYGITGLKKAILGEPNLMAIFNKIDQYTESDYYPDGWPYIKRGRQKVRMVRLKNPWGEKEWKGSYNDGENGDLFLYSSAQLTKMYSRSSEWSQVTAAQRERMGLTFEDDGEFWMTFEDFVENFTDLSICFLINTSMFSMSKTWTEAMFSSAWTIGVRGHYSDRAGGCPNEKASFLRNPQFRFDVKEEEDDVIIQLMQLDDAKEKKKDGMTNLVIGFHIMRVEANRLYRVHTPHEAVTTSDYIRTRSIFLREQLKRGRYVLIPTAFKPDETGEFIIRLFTSKDADAKELTEDQPKIHWYSCVKKPAVLTTISILSASDLEKQSALAEMGNQWKQVKQSWSKNGNHRIRHVRSIEDGDLKAISKLKGAPDPYCLIKCEGEVVRTPFQKATNNPKWDTTAIFYRANPELPIVVEVWNHNLILDAFLGRTEVLAPITSGVTQVELNLFGRRKEKDIQKSGLIIVQVLSDDDFMSV